MVLLSKTKNICLKTGTRKTKSIILSIPIKLEYTTTTKSTRPLSLKTTNLPITMSIYPIVTPLYLETDMRSMAIIRITTSKTPKHSPLLQLRQTIPDPSSRSRVH